MFTAFHHQLPCAFGVKWRRQIERREQRLSGTAADPAMPAFAARIPARIGMMLPVARSGYASIY